MTALVDQMIHTCNLDQQLIFRHFYNLLTHATETLLCLDSGGTFYSNRNSGTFQTDQSVKKLPWKVSRESKNCYIFEMPTIQSNGRKIPIQNFFENLGITCTFNVVLFIYILYKMVLDSQSFTCLIKRMKSILLKNSS